MEKDKMPLYLDAAATTPVDPRVLEAMLPYFSEIFGNASSQHIYGQQAKAAVEKAREQVASIVNVEPSEIIFTSGATEAINLAIKGYWEANRDRGNHDRYAPLIKHHWQAYIDSDAVDPQKPVMQAEVDKL